MFFDVPFSVANPHSFFNTLGGAAPPYVFYPIALLSIILMIIGILLVIIGVGKRLNLYGKKDYYDD